MEPSVKEGLNIFTDGHGLLIKMAPMPIYGKEHFKSFFSRTKKALRLKLGIYHQGLKGYQVCLNDDARLTFKNLFFASSPAPKGQLTRNLVGGIGVTCRSKIAKIVPIVNPR